MFDWILNTFFVQKDKPFPEAFPIPRGQLREVLGAQKDPAAGAAGRNDKAAPEQFFHIHSAPLSENIHTPLP